MVVGDVGNMFGWGSVWQCGKGKWCGVGGAENVFLVCGCPGLAGEGCCCVLMTHVFVDVNVLCVKLVVVFLFQLR